MITASITATDAATAMASASRIRRLSPTSGPAAVIAAAAMSGTATTRASRWSTRLPLQRGQFLRVKRAEPLVGLDGEGQQQRGDRSLDHHVGEGQGLHHGIDRQ